MPIIFLFTHLSILGQHQVPGGISPSSPGRPNGTLNSVKAPATEGVITNKCTCMSESNGWISLACTPSSINSFTVQETLAARIALRPTLPLYHTVRPRVGFIIRLSSFQIGNCSCLIYEVRTVAPIPEILQVWDIVNFTVHISSVNFRLFNGWMHMFYYCAWNIPYAV